MHRVVAFFKLIRYPNLIYIALTQYLLRLAVVVPALHAIHQAASLSSGRFAALVLSTICIAAAGYIINDYFDINIDLVNKPQKMVIDKIISRRWAMAWHTILNGVGILLALYVAWRLGNWWLIIIQIFCTLLLWFYSTSLKRQLLTGNIAIAFLTALTAMVVAFYEPKLYLHVSLANGPYLFRVIMIITLYAVFAFIISLVREIVKDLEDMPGDSKEGCRTTPIVWGIQASKTICYSLIILLLIILIIIQIKIAQWHWYLVITYLFLLVELPLIYIIARLNKAVVPPAYHAVSNFIKIVMLTGILSMLFFKFLF